MAVIGVISATWLNEKRLASVAGALDRIRQEANIDPIEEYEEQKRTFDLCSAILALLVLWPVMILVALMVKLTSKGPIIFRQTRLTIGQKPFTMYKFRTMRVDAEKDGAVWAAKNDSRITPIGKFLRKTRLDELPQLWNVIEGDMSMIGPRPERPEFHSKLAKKYENFDKRLDVKGGITGLAQTSQGYVADESSYGQKLELDLEYVSKRSFLLDLKIAFKTVWVILSGSGAR